MNAVFSFVFLLYTYIYFVIGFDDFVVTWYLIGQHWKLYILCIYLEKSRAEEEKKIEDLRSKLEAAISARQEAEARAAHLEERLKSGAAPAPAGLTHGSIAAIAKVHLLSPSTPSIPPLTLHTPTPLTT